MPYIAALIYEPDHMADARLAALVAECRSHGIRVTGLIQHNRGDCAGGEAFSMELEDIASGTRIPIADPALASTGACRLDADGLAAAAGFLKPERHSASSLVIINKFGRQEALGRGLRAEMAALAAEGIPVLTTVRRDLLPAFEAFVEGEWQEVDATLTPVKAWLDTLKLADRQPA